MKKFLIIILLSGLAATGYAYHDYIGQRFLGLRAQLRNPSKLLTDIITEDLLPPPLKGSLDARDSYLSKSEVFVSTNEQRAKFGLPALKANTKLDSSAQLKLKDMFDKQYFEHISPSGLVPSDLANKVGYAYVIVGENLALGNFKDAKELVDAWMNSPGHRANILNKRYVDIGIAVGKGAFEGKETWLAVQSFGTPLSACPQPSQSVRGQIDVNKQNIGQLETQIAVLKSEIENNRYSHDEYNSKVAEYNALVAEINSLIDRTKALVGEYNTQINAFNTCIEAK